MCVCVCVCVSVYILFNFYSYSIILLVRKKPKQMVHFADKKILHKLISVEKNSGNLLINKM